MKHADYSNWMIRLQKAQMAHPFESRKAHI
jgi:hypothetical protein